MIATVRAILIASAWLVPALASAEECRIGPVAFEAPVCTIKEATEREGSALYTEWREEGTIYTVAVIASKRSNPIRGYFARWRQQRKCTANKIRFNQKVRFEDTRSAGKPRVPPQVTWTGVCITSAGGYITHAIGLKRQVVELHVNRAAGDPAPIEPALASLLDRVRLSPASHE
ncbi:MAG: hypothetical protein P8Y67_14595 [Alphaproteobacteria bacterium]|jgi:hypothetical protein